MNSTAQTERWRTLAWTIVAVESVAVLVGLAWGYALLNFDVIEWSTALWPLCGCASVVLLGVECFRHQSERWKGSPKPIGLVLVLVLLFLALFIIFTDQFLYISRSESDVLFAIVLVLPFIVSAGPLIRAHFWFAVAGTFLIATTAVAMLSYNANLRYQGVGFLGRWVR